jgi:hypothetical protein
MNKLLLICALILMSIKLYAQSSYSIKGSVIDSVSSGVLYNSAVSVLNAKDSTLVKFVRASALGDFEIKNLNKGKYILLIGYPQYADYIDHFKLDSVNKQKNYGKINLTPKAKLLADVIIKGRRAAIKIKGDTTEFDPAAYNIEPNSKVEDLLKQFPGIEVDKDGKITAQGQTVTKVLVDGEEFFGDDPTLVTKNIRSDMVDKVQLYDKKSDQATFTGIDDGVKTKTLNIKLKEDKKKGHFGKVHGGYGTDDFYHAEAMFNRFWNKKKFAAYAITANTGKVGLSWADQEKYGNNSNMTVSDDGGIYITGSGGAFESFSGQYNGSGIPIARTGGLHFDNKWNKDKEMLNTNYKIGSFDVEGLRSGITSRPLINGIINSTSNSTFNNSLFSQKLDFMYEVKLDTMHTLKFSVDGSLKESDNNSVSNSESRRADNSLLNNSEYSSDSHTKNQDFNFATLFTKKFVKKRRTISLTLNQEYSKNNGYGYQKSENNYFDINSNPDSTQRVNQYKINNSINNNFKSNLVYTEPLSKSITVAINYGFNVLNSKSDVKSYNQGANNEYDILDTRFSNDYELDQIHNQLGAVFSLNKGKTVASIGSKFTKVNYEQYDVFRDRMFIRNFVNYTPQASYQYKFSQQKSFRISYNGNTRQPSINQLQPLRDNTNQMYQTIGNPDLKPSFSSNISASYNSYKVLTQENFYIDGSYNFTLNQIISKVDLSSGGQSISQAINLKNKTPMYYNAWAGYSKKLNFPNINAGLSLNFSGNTSYNYLNGALNESKSNRYGTSLNLSQYSNKYYTFNLSGGPTYNVVNNTISTNTNNNGWSWRSRFSFNMKKLPAKIEFATDANFEYQGKTKTFDENFYRTIWNASIVKKFFKAENFKISLSANDILNQNIGFNRSDYNGYISQNSYTTIRRNFIFAALWDFSKMGANVKK